MTLNPSIQSHAQAELDAVLGPGVYRLPTFTDRERLPYIDALVKEVWRWNPSVPLGMYTLMLVIDRAQCACTPMSTECQQCDKVCRICSRRMIRIEDSPCIREPSFGRIFGESISTCAVLMLMSAPYWCIRRSILHDESIFPDPFEFRPERFLDEGGRPRELGRAEDPTAIAFGFGRR